MLLIEHTHPCTAFIHWARYTRAGYCGVYVYTRIYVTYTQGLGPRQIWRRVARKFADPRTTGMNHVFVCPRSPPPTPIIYYLSIRGWNIATLWPTRLFLNSCGEAGHLHHVYAPLCRFVCSNGPFGDIYYTFSLERSICGEEELHLKFLK